MANPKTFTAIDGTDLRRNLEVPCIFDTESSPTAETSFYNTCVDWIRSLRSESRTHGNSNYNVLEWLGHIGFYAARPSSCHCAGKAMDLSKVQWNGLSCRPCASDHLDPDRKVRRRYLAVDASLRQYFQWVINGWYDDKHFNHFHASAHFTPSNIVLQDQADSDVLFVQAVCNNFHFAGLTLDGEWGANTQAAFEDINGAWNYSAGNCNPFTSHSAYLAWLHRVMAAGFADLKAGDVNIVDSCNFPP